MDNSIAATMDKDELAFVEKFQDKRIAWIQDPILFCEEFLGIGICNCNNGKACQLDPLQIEIFKSFAMIVRIKLKKQMELNLAEVEIRTLEKIGLSVMSGKGVGKTCLAAIIGIWFLVCFQDARVVILGPKYDQIKANLWPEITKWLGHAEKVFGPKCLANELLEKMSDKIYMKHVTKVERGERWRMFIQTFPKNADIETQKASIQGNHDENMLFLIDEASAVPDYIFEPIESTLTDPNNLVFAIFNPNKNTGWALETQIKMKAKWICRHINAENSTRVSKTQILYMREKYGVDSNKYRVSVLGLPPIAEEGVLIPWGWIQEAKERWADMQTHPDDYFLHGNDIGAGGDPSINCKRVGYKVLPFKKNSSPDTNAVGNWLVSEAAKDNPDYIFTDSNGIGNKVHADMNAMRIWKCIGINAQGHALDEKFYRLRDQLFWALRCLFEDGLIGIPPNDDELEGELSLLKYSDDEHLGKIKIISKKNEQFRKDMMARVGYKSPNKVDALANTCYYEDGIIRRKKQAQKKRSGTNFPKQKPQTLKRAWMA